MYGLKYQCNFDPIGDFSLTPVYIIEIFQKEYSGEVFQIKGGAVPALHQWDTDDPKAPIKGSSLVMALINENKDLPLNLFYSTDDDEFKVKLSRVVEGTKSVLFIGFLVQDDCSETMLDFTHEINLSANDGLGLLKDVSLDKANIFALSYTSPTIPLGADFPSRTFLTDGSIQPYLAVGDRIEVVTPALIAGFYTVNKIVIAATGYPGATSIFFDEPVPDNYLGSATIKIYKPANLLDKTPLSTILRMCLSATGLNLDTNVYSNLLEISQDNTKCFFEQTLINPQSFMKSETEYSDCYDVLTKILARFNMTLFQARGAWNIVRWDELRYYDNLIPAFTYNSDFVAIGTAIFPNTRVVGVGEDTVAQTGILQKISRPFAYDKQTFNYQYPYQILRNYDLKQLGSLIRTYTTGSGADLRIVSEYNVPWWYDSKLDTVVPREAVYYTRITTDTLENELERVLVVLVSDIKSYQIEANQGDSFKFSFKVKTEDSQNGPINLVFVVELNNGTARKFFHNPDLTNGTTMWQDGVGFVYQIPSSDNSNAWHTVEIDCQRFPIPFDGLIYCYLSVADLSGTIRETYYNDMRFEYTARISESVKIIGQTHQATQLGAIKNNEEVDISIDSSPRNAISGTLFLKEKVGLLQKRASRWKDPYISDAKLGDIITYEQLFWRRVPRTILEGTLYGLISSGNHLSLLSTFKYNFFPDLNFVFGRLEIDYKNDKLDGTLWEIWNDNETSDNLPRHYTFNYLYSAT